MKDEQLIDEGKIVLEKYDKANNLVKTNTVLSGVSTDKENVQSSPNGNPVENSLVSSLHAERFCQNINASIELIESEEYRKIIDGFYIHIKNNKTEFANELNMTRRTLYRHRDNAVKKFAEICPEVKKDTIMSQL